MLNNKEVIIMNELEQVKEYYEDIISRQDKYIDNVEDELYEIEDIIENVFWKKEMNLIDNVDLIGLLKEINYKINKIRNMEV